MERGIKRTTFGQPALLLTKRLPPRWRTRRLLSTSTPKPGLGLIILFTNKTGQIYSCEGENGNNWIFWKNLNLCWCCIWLITAWLRLSIWSTDWCHLSRILFPVSFIIFNICYWLLVAYYDPNATINGFYDLISLWTKKLNMKNKYFICTSFSHKLHIYDASRQLIPNIFKNIWEMSAEKSVSIDLELVN